MNQDDNRTGSYERTRTIDEYVRPRPDGDRDVILQDHDSGRIVDKYVDSDD